MESRPERGVVRRLMWEAAAVSAGAEDPEGEPAAVTPAPGRPGSIPPGGRARPDGGGPGSQIRRYSPEPRPAPAAKKSESNLEEPVKRPD